MRKPFVSVVTITYKHEKYILDTLKSVLNQETEFEIEYIIADDSSPDNTENVVRKYLESHPNSKCVKYARHRKNLGVNKNFIWALKQCQGSYIAICDGDDYWEDKFKLQKQINLFQNNKKLVASFTNAEILHSSQNKSYFLSKPIKSGIVPTKYVIKSGGGLYPTSTLVFKADSFDPQTILEYTTLAPDDVLILSLAMKGHVHYYNIVTCVYRIVSSGVYSNIRNNTAKLIVYKKGTIDGLLKMSSKINDKKYNYFLQMRILKERLFLYQNGVCSVKLFFEIGLLNIFKYQLKSVYKVGRAKIYSIKNELLE